MATSKATKKRLPKKLSKSTKTANDSRELSRIERLLGEDFDTLAQARKALKQESKPVSEKAYKNASHKTPKTTSETPSIRSKKSYTISELNIKQKRTINAFLKDEVTANQIQESILQPNQSFGATITYRYTDPKTGRDKIGHANTYKLYGNLRQLFAALSKYLDRVKGADKKEVFLDGIKVIKWGDPDKEKRDNVVDWLKVRKQQTEDRNARRKELKQAFRKAERRETKISKQEAEIKRLKKENKQLKKQGGKKK